MSATPTPEAPTAPLAAERLTEFQALRDDVRRKLTTPACTTPAGGYWHASQYLRVGALLDEGDELQRAYEALLATPAVPVLGDGAAEEFDAAAFAARMDKATTERRKLLARVPDAVHAVRVARFIVGGTKPEYEILRSNLEPLIEEIDKLRAALTTEAAARAAAEAELKHYNQAAAYNGAMLPDLTHAQVADRVRMLTRSDLDHEVTCVLARNRIIWLARELAAAEARATTAEGEAGELRKKVRQELFDLFGPLLYVGKGKDGLELSQQVRYELAGIAHRLRLEPMPASHTYPAFIIKNYEVFHPGTPPLGKVEPTLDPTPLAKAPGTGEAAERVGLGGHPGCKCGFTTFMVGDGCEKCNPQLAVDFAPGGCLSDEPAPTSVAPSSGQEGGTGRG